MTHPSATVASISTSGTYSLAAELQGIRDQVLHQLPDLQLVGIDRRQRSHMDHCSGVLDLRLEVDQDLAGDLAQIDRWNGCPWVVTRENLSRSSIRRCIRSAAAFVARGSRGPVSERRSPSVTTSCSVKVRTLRSGSCRSCDAIEANWSSSSFDRASSAARRSSVVFAPVRSPLTCSSWVLTARSSSEVRRTCSRAAARREPRSRRHRRSARVAVGAVQ